MTTYITKAAIIRSMVRTTVNHGYQAGQSEDTSEREGGDQERTRGFQVHHPRGATSESHSLHADIAFCQLINQDKSLLQKVQSVHVLVRHDNMDLHNTKHVVENLIGSLAWPRRVKPDAWRAAWRANVWFRPNSKR
jgi:hypothetical protein